MTVGKLVLEAEVPVECHVIQADISRASKTPYILPILMHVQELDGEATAESLANELFAGSKPLSRRLLDICCDDGLTERDCQRYALTEEGSSAIDNERIFASEEKMWKVYYSPLPVIPDTRKVLKLEDGRREAGFREEDPKPERPEEHVKELKQRIMTTSFGERQDFRINGIAGMAKRIKGDMRVTLRLEIGGEGSVLSLSSSYVNTPLKGRLETRGPQARPGGGSSDESISLNGPNTTYEEAWNQLLEQESISGWDHDNNRLRIPYDDTGPKERSTMKKTLDFEPRILGVRFNPLNETVSIYPENQRDAQRWADDLLMDKVRDYLTHDRYQKITGEIKAQFPDFEVSFKDRADYVEETERGSTKFWHIQAAEDWRL